MPFLPPNQQRQSTEGTSTEGTKKGKKETHTKENWFLFSASRCTRLQEMAVVCSVCECLTCSRLSWLMSAFERTLKQHLVSYRIKRTSTDTHRVNTLPVWTLMSSAVQSTDPVTIRLSLLWQSIHVTSSSCPVLPAASVKTLVPDLRSSSFTAPSA